MSFTIQDAREIVSPPQRTENQCNLAGFVRQVREQAPKAPDPDRFIANSLAMVERQMANLDRWAASGNGPCPPLLVGLTAFDLADAADQLRAMEGAF